MATGRPPPQIYRTKDTSVASRDHTSPSETPPSTSKLKRKPMSLEAVMQSPIPVPSSAHGNRSMRRRLNYEPKLGEDITVIDPLQIYKFHVLLPNRTSVEINVGGEVCQSLTVERFVRLIREEQVKSPDANVKEKQRQIQWGSNVRIEDLDENIVEDGGFMPSSDVNTPRVLVLQDNHPDSVHAHSAFWNITPEPHMLEVLPQDYTLFSALADELDNSLQAVSQLKSGKQRLICVDLDHMNGKITIFDTGKGMDSTAKNSIANWGTIGSSTNRHSLSEAIGGEPPYLKPNFGMYGFGGIGAGLHLGGSITVSSKTEQSYRVAVLHLGRNSLQSSVKAGSAWKTAGEFRSPTEEELQLSPHGSFTKVEISDLNPRVTTWKVEEVQRKLKDYYFPYIQNDEGSSGRTSRPVDIRVNGNDLAGVLGGEVAVTNSLSGNGEPYVLILELTKPKDMYILEQEKTMVNANARITCLYFPITKGKEAIDVILEELKKKDTNLMDETFDTFSRRAVRRLGRLLPDARGGRLPFMEPKRGSKANEVNKQCFKRVKAFIDIDAGFVPTTSKMDLVSKDPFTEALLNLGQGHSSETTKSTNRKPGTVIVSIKKNGRSIRPEQLHADYVEWVTKQHMKYDEGATFDEKDCTLIFTQSHNKEELGITNEVFRIVYGIKSRNIEWRVGKDDPPIRLKLLKGCPGLNNNDCQLYATVECFISEGLAEAPGETRIICRPMVVPVEDGSKEIEGDLDQDPSFILGKSRVFPLEILFTDKFEEVDEAVWQKQEEKIWSKSPSFVELLNEQEILKFGGEGILEKNANIKAGTPLPSEIVVVVRPRSCKQSATEGTRSSSKCTPRSRTEQRYIVAEPMEMRLVVKRMDFRSSLKVPSKKDVLEAQKVYDTKVKMCTRSNVKGLYCFSTGGTSLESLTKLTGTYTFFFKPVKGSTSFVDIEGAFAQLNVSASDNVASWKICSHPGDCSVHHKGRNHEKMRCRLGGVVPGSLYLYKFDEFNNPMEFSRVPKDMQCQLYTLEGSVVEISTTITREHLLVSDTDRFSLEIPRIEVSGGDLEILKPNHQAELKIIMSNTAVAGFPVTVLPGRVAAACVKGTEAPDNCLHPGQIIEQIVFQALDKYGNPVEQGDRLKLLIEGLQLQDKAGHTRAVDENGCLDLGMRLRVTARYGGRAHIELRSVEDLHLWETTFNIVKRTLRIINSPSQATEGSQLEGILVEAIDEHGHVDELMDGASHTLTLDWNPNISVPLRQGRCTLPAIQVPDFSGRWKGRVAHMQNPELSAEILVFVEGSERSSQFFLAEDDPYALLESTESPFILPTRSSVQALVVHSQEEMAVSQADRYNGIVRVALQHTMDYTKNMQEKLQRLGRKVKKYDIDLSKLETSKNEFLGATKYYQDELKKLNSDVKVEAPYELGAAIPSSWEKDHVNGKCTPTQVVEQISRLGHPSGTHAATILLEAQKDQYNEFAKEDILGIVALLGSAESDAINRALVEFLTVENMLAIVCGSRGAVECVKGSHDASGNGYEIRGLHGFARSHNLLISGRFRIIALTNVARFYKRLDGQPAVDNNHPQKLLNITSPDVDGFLGYAVNLIHLNQDQLKIRVCGHGLRESLFFKLFSFCQVFDTTENMLQARESIRTGAVSLDGGLIRDEDYIELGRREDPLVQFPVVLDPETSQRSWSAVLERPPQNVSSTNAQRIELLGKIEAARKRFIEEDVETKIWKLTAEREQAHKKIESLTQKLNEAIEKSRPITANLCPPSGSGTC